MFMKIKVVKDAPVKKSSVGQVVKASISLPYSGGGTSIVTGGSGDGGDVPPPVNYTYALKSSAYDYAELATEVTVPHKGIISFSFVVDAGDTTTKYLLRGSSNSYVYYRGSDGRFRLYSDQGNFYSVNIPNLNDGKRHDILLTIDDEGMQVYLDGDFFALALNRGTTDTFSVYQIGFDATTFNVTLANLSSYPMLTYDTSSVNVTDEISGNDLVYVNLKNPLDDNDYLGVIDND